jgi:pSer/pThr/pTyr-binding forkhead associated (FHA) protein
LTDINEFILGRGNSSDFSINDDTISRKHCKIHYDDIRGRFFVSDMESKFGTLMELESVRITLYVDKVYRFGDGSAGSAHTQNRQSYKKELPIEDICVLQPVSKCIGGVVRRREDNQE